MVSMELLVEKVERSLDGVTTEQKDKLYKTLDVTFEEKFKYFEVNSQMFASGMIPIEVSQFIYNKLKDYDVTKLAERIVITQVMGELLKKRLSK